MLKRQLFKVPFLILLLIFSVVITCSAQHVQKVAILPVFCKAKTFDADVGAVIDEALQNKFRTPLSGIVPVYALIPEAETQKALFAIKTVKGPQLRPDKTFMGDIAERTGADIVITAEITDYYAMTSFAMDGEILQETNLNIRVIYYDRRSGQFIEKGDRESYSGSLINWSEPVYIAHQIMDRILVKIPPIN